MKTSRPLLVWQSMLAGAQVLSGAAALSDVIGERWWGLAVVGIAAMQAATAYYVHGLGQPAPPQ